MAEGRRIRDAIENIIVRTQHELSALTDPAEIATILRAEFAKIGTTDTEIAEGDQ
ncbi:MAG: hypothetical protein MZV70_64060 [Desulfobacterales bacterium]|nr:hypothetical protein [Desulfobacterales bacterium]